MRFRALLIGVVVVADVVACSGSVRGSKSDAGRDVAPRTDAAADAGTVCAPLDLVTLCPGGAAAECQPTWAEALAHPFCMGYPWIASNFTMPVDTDCGAYHVRTNYRTESEETYVYDIASGELVEIYWGGKCFGPPGGISFDCTGATKSYVCTLFGGGLSNTDAGLVTDGGAPYCLPVDAGAILPPPPLSWNAPCARDGGANAEAACYASCTVAQGTYKYVGCVTGSPVGTMCYASCSECP